MLLFVSSVKLIAEIALLALAGQWLLGLLAGQKRDKNFFYRTLAVLTDPFIKGARLITPRVVLDRHIPLVAFLLLVIPTGGIASLAIGIWSIIDAYRVAGGKAPLW